MNLCHNDLLNTQLAVMLLVPGLCGLGCVVHVCACMSIQLQS